MRVLVVLLLSVATTNAIDTLASCANINSVMGKVIDPAAPICLAMFYPLTEVKTPKVHCMAFWDGMECLSGVVYPPDPPACLASMRSVVKTSKDTILGLISTMGATLANPKFDPNKCEQAKEKQGHKQNFKVDNDLEKCYDPVSLRAALDGCQPQTDVSVTNEHCRQFAETLECVAGNLFAESDEGNQRSKCVTYIRDFLLRHKDQVPTEMHQLSNMDFDKCRERESVCEDGEPMDNVNCSQASCPDHYKCVRGYCCPKEEKRLSACEEEFRAAAKDLLVTGLCGDGRSLTELPRCQNDEFARTQGGQNGLQYCAYVDGKKVAGSDFTGNVNCARVRPGLCPAATCSTPDLVLCSDDMDSRCKKGEKCCMTTIEGQCVQNCVTAITVDPTVSTPDDCAQRSCCRLDLCDNKRCPAHPSAVCRINSCGGCSAEFFDANDNKVNCFQGVSKCMKQQEEGRRMNADRKSESEKVKKFIEHRWSGDTSGSESDGTDWMTGMGGGTGSMGGGTGSMGGGDGMGDRDVDEYGNQRESGHMQDDRTRDPIRDSDDMDGDKTGTKRCFLDQDVGMCNAVIPSWYYDNQMATCKQFNYTGCQGNGNRFSTLADCNSACADRDPMCPAADNPLVDIATGQTYNCGMAGKACPDGFTCRSHPADRFAICCKKEPLCPIGEPLVDPNTGVNIHCGRGGQRCPDGFTCRIHPADQFAVCCKTVEPFVTSVCDIFDRYGVCKNGGHCDLGGVETTHWHVCSCAKGFYGLFCELAFPQPGTCDADKQSNCEENPCESSACPLVPNAVCEANYCGGCNALWIVGTTYVTEQCYDKQCWTDKIHLTTTWNLLGQQNDGAKLIHSLLTMFHPPNEIYPFITCDDNGDYTPEQEGSFIPFKREHGSILYCVDPTTGVRIPHTDISWKDAGETIDCTQRTQVDILSLPRRCNAPIRDCKDTNMCVGQWYYDNHKQECVRALAGWGFESLDACYDDCQYRYHPNMPAGECPTLPDGTFGTCDEACNDCEAKGQLCCSNGCGHMCKDPVLPLVEPIPCEGENCDYSAEFCDVTNGTTGQCMTFQQHCLDEADPGYGERSVGAYYFNAVKRKCEKFLYTGLGGNGNRFYSIHQCHTECGVKKYRFVDIVCPRAQFLLYHMDMKVLDNVCDNDFDCAEEEVCCSNDHVSVCTAPITACSNGYRCSFYGWCGDSNECVCPNCTDVPVNKVCGSDRKTHDNECQLNLHACRVGKHIVKASDGECTTPDPVDPQQCEANTFCTDEYNPVCTYDQTSSVANLRTFSNMCQYKTKIRCNNSIAEGDMPILYMGECNKRECGSAVCAVYEKCLENVCGCQDTCDTSYSPVCGHALGGGEARTFSNTCEMEKVACELPEIYVIKNKGTCDKHTTEDEYECPAMREDIPNSADSTCSRDSNTGCDSTSQKCCPYGTGHRCVLKRDMKPKVTWKHGLCSLQSALTFDESQCDSSSCDHDGDCGGDAKCCANDVCGYTTCSMPLDTSKICGVGFSVVQGMTCDPSDLTSCPGASTCKNLPTPMTTVNVDVCCVSDQNNDTITKEAIMTTMFCNQMKQIGLGCQNGGTCIGNLKDAKICECAAGFYGPFCERNLPKLNENGVCDGPTVSCLRDPCDGIETCPLHPNATCSTSYCGACYAIWTDNGQVVTTTCHDSHCFRQQYISMKFGSKLARKQKDDGELCEDGAAPVMCYRNPCDGHDTCPEHPDAVCHTDYCTGCNPIWKLPTGENVTATCKAVDPCTNTNAVMAVMNKPEGAACIPKFTGLTMPGSSTVHCKSFWDGIDCMIGVLAPPNHDTCLASIRELVKTDQDKIFDFMATMGASLHDPDFDPTKCSQYSGARRKRLAKEPRNGQGADDDDDTDNDDTKTLTSHSGTPNMDTPSMCIVEDPNVVNLLRLLKAAGFGEMFHNVECDASGDFVPKQCQVSGDDCRSMRCACTDRAGMMHGSTMSDRRHLRCDGINSDTPKFCLMKPNDMVCGETSTRFYFDISQSDCFEFTDGGCERNQNSFEDKETCLTTCISPDVTKAECGKKNCDSGTICRFRNGMAQCVAKEQPGPNGGQFEPRCVDNDMFEPRQCQGDVCVCVSPEMGDMVDNSIDMGGHLKCVRNAAGAINPDFGDGQRQPPVCADGTTAKFCKNGGLPCRDCETTNSETAGQAPDDQGKCPCEECPNGESPKKCSAKCKPNSCKRFPEATCRVDRCTCKKVYTDAADNPVDCTKIHSQCARTKTMNEKERRAMQAAGVTENLPDTIACNDKNGFESACNNGKCSCLNAATGVRATNDEVDADALNCEATQKKSKVLQVKLKFKLSKTPLSQYTKPQREEMKTGLTKVIVLKTDLAVLNIMLYDGSVMADVTVEGANSDTDITTNVLAWNAEVLDGNVSLNITGEILNLSEPTNELLTAEDLGSDPTPIPIDDDDDDETTIIIIVIVVAVVVIIIIGVSIFCYTSSRRKKETDIHFDNLHGQTNPTYKH